MLDWIKRASPPTLDDALLLYLPFKHAHMNKTISLTRLRNAFKEAGFTTKTIKHKDKEKFQLYRIMSADVDTGHRIIKRGKYTELSIGLSETLKVDILANLEPVVVKGTSVAFGIYTIHNFYAGMIKQEDKKVDDTVKKIIEDQLVDADGKKITIAEEPKKVDGKKSKKPVGKAPKEGEVKGEMVKVRIDRKTMKIVE